MSNNLVWIATYSDGKIICQINGTNNAISTSELSRVGLRRITLVDRYGKAIASQDYLPGQRMLYRRRSAISQGSGIINITHILGWAVFDDNGIASALHVAFVSEKDLSVQMGYFVDSTNGVKYPISLQSEDMIPIT